MSVVFFVGKCRKSEINTKSKVMSLLATRTDGRSQIDLNIAANLSHRLSSFIFAEKGRKFDNKNIGLCPVDYSTESWVIN